MIMKKFLKMMMATVCAVTLCCLVGCGGNSPKAVVEDYFETMQAGKLDEAYVNKHFSKASLAFLRETQQLKSGIKRTNRMGTEIKSFSVKGVEMDGDRAAKVTVVGKKRSGEEREDTVDVVKEDGVWKLNF